MQHLDDLGTRFRLFVVCEPCARMVPAPVSALRARHGNLPLAAVAAALRCSRCGHRASGVRIVYSASGGYRRALVEAPVSGADGG